MAKKDYTETKTIFNIRRAGASVNGNPAWVLTFDDLTFARTMSGASWSYEASSSKWLNKPVLVTFTPAGRVRWVEHIETEPVHADYPHESGTLHDCLGCEANCYCDDGYTCISCIKQS